MPLAHSGIPLCAPENSLSVENGEGERTHLCFRENVGWET